MYEYFICFEAAIHESSYISGFIILIINEPFALVFDLSLFILISI